MTWDIAAVFIALAVSTCTFVFAMIIIRHDLARSAKELAQWKHDMLKIEEHDLAQKIHKYK